jgi:hypothetical protein
MNIKLLLPLASLALIIGGGQSVYTALTNRAPTDVDVAAAYKKSPEGKWLRLHQGVLHTLEAGYTSTLGVGDAHEIYVPLLPPGQDPDTGKIKILVKTSDPDLLAFTNEGRKFKENAKPAEVVAFLAKNAAKMRVQRDVEGLVQYGIDSGKKESKIRRLFDNLDKDAFIIEEGTKPNVGQGAGLLAAGLALGGFLIRRVTRPTPAAPPAA